MGSYNPIVIQYSLHLAFLLSILLSACASTRAQSCTASYTVQSGDTCDGISQANSISLSDFESWNAGINCDNLQIGQSVCVSAPSSSSSPSSSSTNGKVLREYIGAEGKGVTLTSMPIISTNVEVHYILSFAIDYTSDSSSAPSPTNGNFAPFWDTGNLTPESVKAIKAQYANVKVMLSLGGDTVGQDTHVQFQPTSVSSWVSNAVSSLTSLVQQYGLDGIDVDYEHFDSITNNEDFSSAIGQLITQLKQQNVISVASIAPFDGVEAPYKALWAKYSSVFDYVNFQFYTYGKSTTVAEYITHYNTAATKTYSGGKVLASFTTADAADSVTPTNALAACKQLQASNSLPGIFIWSADDSYVSTAAPNFEYEQQAQKLLAAA